MEGEIPDKLVPRANEEPALAREPEERFRLLRRLDERLLDVHVRPSEERLARGLEMRARRRADVYEVWLRPLEQVGDSDEGRSAGAFSEGRSRRAPHVGYPHDNVHRRDAAQRLQVMAGHVTSADEGDAQRAEVVDGHQRAWIGCATALTTNSLMPIKPLIRARRSDAARSSFRASA